MMRLAFTPNDADFIGRNDSESIQNAIDKAAELGVNKVTIPRYNKRSDSFEWIITEAIRLPSYMVVVFDNCHLTRAKGTYCNMFINSACYTDEGATICGEQIGIKLIGEGNVVLDGGEPNGLVERTAHKFGLPSIWNNSTILFHNVKDFLIENIHFGHLRWNAITMLYCNYGKLCDLSFMEYEDHPVYPVEYSAIDLRLGCHNVIIEDITGKSAYASVCLGATKRDLKDQAAVMGKPMDIHDIIIKNLRTDAYASHMVYMYNNDGCKLYNILVDGVVDSSRRETKRPSASIVRVGDTFYTAERTSRLGETYNITVRNVTSRSSNSILLCGTLRNSYFSNIHLFGDGLNIIGTAGSPELHNVMFDGLFYDSAQQEICMSSALSKSAYHGTVINLLNVSGDNVHFRNVFVNKVRNVFNISSGKAPLTVKADNVHPGEYGGSLLAKSGECTVYLEGEEQK